MVCYRPTRHNTPSFSFSKLLLLQASPNPISLFHTKLLLIQSVFLFQSSFNSICPLPLPPRISTVISAISSSLFQSLLSPLQSLLSSLFESPMSSPQSLPPYSNLLCHLYNLIQPPNPICRCWCGSPSRGRWASTWRPPSWPPSPAASSPSRPRDENSRTRARPEMVRRDTDS